MRGELRRESEFDAAGNDLAFMGMASFEDGGGDMHFHDRALLAAGVE
jgi:hypothetical protein